MTDALSEIAKQKQGKTPGGWVSMSTIGQRGKTIDIKVSATEGTEADFIVQGPKNSGQGNSNLGFAKGEVFSQNLDD